MLSCSEPILSQALLKVAQSLVGDSVKKQECFPTHPTASVPEVPVGFLPTQRRVNVSGGGVNCDVTALSFVKAASWPRSAISS